MQICIVEPIAGSEWANSLKHVVSGSVMVHVYRDERHWVHYEGGIYRREPSDFVSERERDRYAIQAAMRASTNYPTIAKTSRATPDGLRVIGYVDTETWKVTWRDTPLDLSIVMPQEDYS